MQTQAFTELRKIIDERAQGRKIWLLGQLHLCQFIKYSKIMASDYREAGVAAIANTNSYLVMVDTDNSSTIILRGFLRALNIIMPGKLDKTRIIRDHTQGMQLTYEFVKKMGSKLI